MPETAGPYPTLRERVQRALAASYAIERELGGGGMSCVFVAEEVALGRHVVVKVLPPELAAELSTERFAREIRLAAGLQQANIIPVLHAGDADGLPFYTMPFVEGLSLRERIDRDGLLPIGEAIAVLCDVAKALAYAHSHGVVHRDIKPSNVLLSGGTAVVTDFGIAKAMLSARAAEPGATLTQLGTAIGTPAYMAPEQAAGDPATDHRADIYSWGVMAYELVVGTHPFGDRNAPHQLIAAHMTVRPKPIAAGRADVPTLVADLIMRCLEKDPEARPQHAEMLVRELERYGSAARTLMLAQPPTYESIAVLAFSNLSSNSEDEYLSDGISEDLIHALSKLSGLRVVARTSAFAFKGKHQDVRTIGTELGVACLLDGSVRRAGNRLRITAQLVDTRNGYELWSERYDRELTDVFDVQDEISRSIVETLRLSLLREPRRLVTVATASIDAYDMYLKGRFHWNLRTETGFLRSLKFFNGAVAADPDFALAETGLADTYVMLAIYGALPPRDAMPKARAAADRVLELDPRSPEAMTARGSVRALFDYDWAAAEADFLAATEAGPQYPTTHHWYAMHYLVPRGRFSEADARLTRAHALDPLSHAISASVGILRYFERRFADAAAIHQKVLEQDPSFALSYYFLGQALTQLGRHAEALEALNQGVLLTNGSSEVESALGVAHSAAGNHTIAREVLARLVAKADARYVSPVLLAQVHLSLGDVETAVALVERGYELRASEIPMLGVRPTFDALRGEPRFDEIMRLVQGTGESSLGAA